MHKDTKNTMLFRHAVVSLVLSKVAAGQALSDVIAKITDFEFSSFVNDLFFPCKNDRRNRLGPFRRRGATAG